VGWTERTLGIGMRYRALGSLGHEGQAQDQKWQ
jgi:hypothetical protein